MYIFKTDKEWMAELCIGQFSVREARKLLCEKKLLNTEVHRAKGKPTVHYYLQHTALLQSWGDFVDAKKAKNQQ